MTRTIGQITEDLASEEVRLERAIDGILAEVGVSFINLDLAIKSFIKLNSQPANIAREGGRVTSKVLTYDSINYSFILNRVNGKVAFIDLLQGMTFKVRKLIIREEGLVTGTSYTLTNGN